MPLTVLIYAAVIMMGMGAAMIGTFAHYRGRTLLADACAHATLPGVAIGFLIALALDINGGRSLPIMMITAAAAAMGAALCVRFIETQTRLGRDVAIAATLSVFYGAGIVLLSYIQRLEHAAQAGLESFLLGQITGITVADAYFIMACAGSLMIITTLLVRPLTHLCFDETHMHTTLRGGAAIRMYDIILTALIVAILCVGIRMMGVILMLALLIIPPITARLWSATMPRVLATAAFIGASACLVGAMLSVYIDDLPAGATIVLCAGGAFLFSLIIKLLFNINISAVKT